MSEIIVFIIVDIVSCSTLVVGQIERVTSTLHFPQLKCTFWMISHRRIIPPAQPDALSH